MHNAECTAAPTQSGILHCAFCILHFAFQISIVSLRSAFPAYSIVTRIASGGGS
jgi:hypothetical protein